MDVDVVVLSGRVVVLLVVEGAVDSLLHAAARTTIVRSVVEDREIGFRASPRDSLRPACSEGLPAGSGSREAQRRTSL